MLGRKPITERMSISEVEGRYSRHEAERALDLLRTKAVIVAPAEVVPDITPDREDDLVLATAVAGNAD